MTVFLKIFLHLLIFPGIRPGECSLAAYLHHQLSLWCQFYPFGVIYSNGDYSLCRKAKTSRQLGGLEQITLRIGIFEGDDFAYDGDGEGEAAIGKVNSKGSYSQYILDLLQEILHFDSWGYYDSSNHTWNGLLGLMAYNITDIAVCHLTTTVDFAEMAQHLVPIQETTESFVYLPQNLPMTQDVFMEIFSRKLWLFFLFFIFLLVVSLKFSTYMHSTVRPDHEPWSWDEVALWAVAAVSQQSYSRHPRGSSCRSMFLIGYSITYLLYTGFAAGITSLLALQDHRSQLNFEDVANMNLKLILQGEKNYADFLQTRIESNSLNLSLGKSEIGNLSQIFDRIEKTNFVGFGSTSAILNFLKTKMNSRERENYQVVPIPYSRRLKGFLIQKTFPFKGILNYWLIRLKENGLLDFGKKRFLQVNEAANYKNTRWMSADLRNVFSAFVFLMVGWYLSVFVLCLEIFWKRIKLREK